MNLSKRALSVKPSSTLAITTKAKQMKAEGIDVISFGAGEPDFDTPDHIKNSAIKAMNEGFTKYTHEAGTVELREAICKKLLQDNNLHYHYTQIVVSNGAKHSLTNIFSAILNEGDEVIIPAPFWLSYPQMVKLASGTPIIVYTTEQNNFKITVSELEKACTEKTKAVLINSPNNPTGMVYTKEELSAIADFVVEKDILVISDEIYEKLIYDDEVEQMSIASLNEEIFKRTIIVNGFSKSYAMTGWRVGYTASSAEIAKLMSNVQSHSTSNINSIAQAASVSALEGDQTCIEKMCAAYKKRRDYMYDRIIKIPQLSAIKPQGAFYIFIDVSSLLGKNIDGKPIERATDLGAILLEKCNVAVIPCEDFGYDMYIRLSYATSIENIEKGMDRMEQFIVNYYDHKTIDTNKRF